MPRKTKKHTESGIEFKDIGEKLVDDVSEVTAPMIKNIVTDLTKAIRNLKLLDRELKSIGKAPAAFHYPEYPVEPPHGRPVTLKVQGTLMNSTIETLSSVKDSTLAKRFLPNEYTPGCLPYNIDRDPIIFKHILYYLRSNRKYLPRKIGTN